METQTPNEAPKGIAGQWASPVCDVVLFRFISASSAIGQDRGAGQEKKTYKERRGRSETAAGFTEQAG